MIQKHIKRNAISREKVKAKLVKPNWLDAQKRWNKVLLARIDPALAQFKHSLLSK